MSLLRLSIAAALLVSCSSSAAAAVQDPALRGRVLDGAGRPVPGTEVALHRVTPAGGAIVARDTTSDDGRFDLSLPAADDDAVFFAATRIDGRLYIGAIVRRTETPAQYDIIAAGPGVQAAAPPGPGSADAPAPPPRWPLVLGVVLLLGGGSALVIRSMRPAGPAGHRRLLLEIVALEEDHAGRADALSAEDRERFLRHRAQLYDRLRAAAQRSP